MRIAHEAPLCVFDQVQRMTDYDYFLVHLFEENPLYLRKILEARGVLDRHVILDNSIFELGTAFDPERFVYWINQTNPSEYIIPDVLEDSYNTVVQLEDWVSFFKLQIKNSNIKTIGVVQGNSYEDLVFCYKNIQYHVDKIAISFDYSFMVPEYIRLNANEYVINECFVLGRQQLLKNMLDDGIINTEKPHHLLGCFRADEFIAYKDYLWIDTIDTSNPVMCGYDYSEYILNSKNHYMYETKPKTKLFSIIDNDLTDTQKRCVFNNIEKFKRNLL